MDNMIEIKKNDYFVPQIRTLFLMLGNGCNFHCGYCLQRPITHTCLKNEVSEDVIECLINLAQKNYTPLHIQFYGGEPLVYWDTFKEVIEKLEPYEEKFSYSTISNGKLLTEDKVEFLNKHNVTVTISWDGNQSAKSRGENVFEDEEFKKNFFNLNRAGLSGVINKYAYPWDMCMDHSTIFNLWLKHNHTYHMHSNFDLIFDTGGLSNMELLDVDYDRISRDVIKMCREYDKGICGSVANPVAYQIINNAINNLKWGVEKNLIFSKASCGNGYNVLNMDLQGNLYYCHNGTDSYGTIKDQFWDLIDRVLKWDKTAARN